MNKEKLAKLEAGVRIGGPGSARRKRKIIRKSSTTDDKKLQNSLKKLSVNSISGIEEVNMIKDDGTVIHFNNPKVQASLNANTFAISGHGEHKEITDMLPSILSHMGQEGFGHLKKVPTPAGASPVKLEEITVAPAVDEDGEIPILVDDFETASKKDPAPKSTEKKKGASENKENKPEQSKKSKKKKKKTNTAAATEASGKAKDGGEADDEGEDGK